LHKEWRHTTMSDQILTMNKNLVDANGRPIIVPKIEDVNAEDIPIEERGLQLPEPKGYKILCAIPDAAETYQGGIVKADSTRTIEEHSTVVLFVVKVGDLAYKDEIRFPTGPWCKEGDFVLTRAYAGTRFKIHGREFRIINDDTVEGVVEDPRGYTRA
jgi:co-chaperonin GroES (HSP10)